MKVELTLGDGSSVTLDLPDDDPQAASLRLLKGKDEYAAGWVTARGGY